MTWNEAADTGLIVLLAFVLQLLASEVGYRLGARDEAKEGETWQASSVQSAVLALMGLLLAFSFSMAAVRYEERRDLVVEETNAIGTAYLRTRILPEPDQSSVRALLRDYVDARLAFFDARTPEEIAAAIQGSEVLLGRIWASVLGPAEDEPGHLSRSLLVESANLVIDLHAKRVAANDARIPPRILVLLALVTIAGLGTLGWHYGLSRGAHRGPALLVAGLVSAILVVIMDLDEPFHGRIRVPAESMRHLKAELDAAP